MQRKDISMKERIKNRVHELYWNDDINCARTAIICLGELFETAIEPQTIWSAVGLHEKAFGSLRCLELRPTGFSENDPPHMCENLTCDGIEFAYQYILQVTKQYFQ